MSTMSRDFPKAFTSHMPEEMPIIPGEIPIIMCPAPADPIRCPEPKEPAGGHSGMKVLTLPVGPAETVESSPVRGTALPILA